MQEILPLLIGGLVLFLYAITQLSNAMQGIFSENVKKGIEKYTSHLFSAVVIGTIMTILMQSSSAVIILVIVFINAKTLNFKQAIGIILGANIGTTFSSQVISLDIGQYAVIPLFIGLLFEVFVTNQKWRKYGAATMYFGMLFFGLYIMETSVVPLKESSLFTEWIERVEGSPVDGALVGGLITLIIQSSSGTVGMAIVLFKQHLLSASAGVAIMLGAELGTCSDTLLATVNGRRQSLKAGLFHLFFNLTTIIIGLILFVPFLDVVKYFTESIHFANIIANAHVLFNILGVLLFLPFVGIWERALNKLLPEKPKTLP